MFVWLEIFSLTTHIYQFFDMGKDDGSATMVGTKLRADKTNLTAWTAMHIGFARGSTSSYTTKHLTDDTCSLDTDAVDASGSTAAVRAKTPNVDAANTMRTGGATAIT